MGIAAPGVERQRTLVGAPVTVLLVDDEQVLLRTTRRMLEQRGLNVICAETPEAAMDVIASGRPVDLLMTDVGLKRASGVDLVRRARAVRPALRVLYVSGLDAECVGLDAQEGHLEAFLGKPYTSRELDDRLRDLLLPVAG